MTNLINYKFTSFFSKTIAIINDVCKHLKQQYMPMQEPEHEFIFNDTTRHCPKDYNDLALIYSIIHSLFKDIKDTQLFNTLIIEMKYANMPSCKTWDDGLVMSLPDVLDSPFSNVITKCADRMSCTYWILRYDDRTDIVRPHQNRGMFRTYNQIIEINDKPDAMPNGVISAIQVTLGVVQTDDNLLKGFQWKLYR